MKLRLLCVICTASLTLCSASTVMSALLDRGGGLIYDTDLDITWLQDANYAKTSGFDPDGRITWYSAMSWVANLTYFDSVRNRTWSDWRLPSAVSQTGSDPCFNLNCAESEMGRLHYIDGISDESPGPFVNFQNLSYWANTSRAPLSGAWLFLFAIGKQDFTGPLEELLVAYAWPVRDGDVAGVIPTANDDSTAVKEGLPVTIDVAANDTDADDGLDLDSIRIVSGPGNGNISAVRSDGTVDYMHNGSETVADSFSYTVDDLSGATSNVASVSITVNPQNDAPTAHDDHASVTVGATVTIDLIANDTDVDNTLDPASIQTVHMPAKGNVSVNADGTVTYAPSSVPGDTTDTFTYTVSDQAGAPSNTAAVTVAINPADSNNDGISDIKATALGLALNDPDGDTDNDLISDIVEVGSSIDNPLDSDGDGIIDALEPGDSAADAALAEGLSLHGDESVRITTAAGETLSEVASATALGGPTGISFPFGMLGYTTTAPVGGNVTVRMNFSNRLPANPALFKVDHAGVFTELPRSVWTQVDPRTLDITLTDGDPTTDLDGTANGFIDDPIAIGDVTAASTPVASPDSGGGGGGCTLTPTTGGSTDPGLPILLLVSLGYLVRREALSGNNDEKGNP